MEVGVAEGEPILQLVLPKEALKAQVAVYTKAIKEALQAAAVKAVVAEAASAEGAATELVVIESDEGDDKGDDEGDDKDAYAAFKAVEVEDKVKEAA